MGKISPLFKAVELVPCPSPSRDTSDPHPSHSSSPPWKIELKPAEPSTCACQGSGQVPGLRALEAGSPSHCITHPLHPTLIKYSTSAAAHQELKVKDVDDFLVAQLVKNLPAGQEVQGLILNEDHPGFTRRWLPTPVFLLEKSWTREGSLMSYS